MVSKRPSGCAAIALCLTFAFWPGGWQCQGQSVISAQSGLIHLAEGRVLLNGRAVPARSGRFLHMQTGDVLSTRGGRAEVLLSPKAFLRVGEGSAVRLVSESVTDSRFEILRGSVILEVSEIQRGTSVMAIWKDATVRASKAGVYRLDAAPAALRVFEGQAVARVSGADFKIGKGRMLRFDGSRAAIKFDREKQDALDLWSRRRAGYLGVENRRGLRRGRTIGIRWGRSVANSSLGASQAGPEAGGGEPNPPGESNGGSP